jgi:hypothetical protein
VLADEGEEVWGNGHVPDPCVALRLLDEGLPIGPTTASSSASVAGLIFFTRLALPPPRMWQGFDRMSSSRTAWPRMVRSGP